MSPRSESWSDHLRTDGEDPQAFLLVGQTLVQLLDLADKGFAPAGDRIVRKEAASVDWNHAYRDSPHILTKMAQSFGVPIPAELPNHDDDLGSAMRQTMDQLKRVMTRVEASPIRAPACLPTTRCRPTS